MFPIQSPCLHVSYSISLLTCFLFNLLAYMLLSLSLQGYGTLRTNLPHNYLSNYTFQMRLVLINCDRIGLLLLCWKSTLKKHANIDDQIRVVCFSTNIFSEFHPLASEFNFVQNESRFTFSWPFSYISFSYFTFPGSLYQIFLQYLIGLPCHFILSPNNITQTEYTDWVLPTYSHSAWLILDEVFP